MKNFIGVMLLVFVGSVMAEQPGEEILRRSDTLVAAESFQLQSVYWQGLRYWQEGNAVQAMRELDYAAWQGSIAAAQRLCVMDAYGMGTEPNVQKAMFWCDKAARAGHDVVTVREYLERSWVATN